MNLGRKKFINYLKHIPEESKRSFLIKLLKKGWKECKYCPNLVPSDDIRCDECRPSRGY